jgi:hypothetical protein
VTADEWLATKGAELDRRLKRFARRLQHGELDGVEFRDGRLHVTPVKGTTTPETRVFADGIEAMLPRVRITGHYQVVSRELHKAELRLGCQAACASVVTSRQVWKAPSRAVRC